MMPAITDGALSRATFARRFTLFGKLGLTSLLALGVQVAAVGTTYFSNLLAARLAGAAEYGDYAYASAAVVILGYLAALGYDSALMRWLPSYLEQQAWAPLAGAIRFVERRVKIVGGTVAAFGLALVTVAHAAHARGPLLVFAIGLVLVPVSALILIRCAIVRAFGKVLVALASDRLFRDGCLLVLLSFMGLFRPFRVDAVVLMCATAVSWLLALAFASRVAQQACRPTHHSAYEGPETRIWSRAALPFLTLVITEVLINRCGVLILGTLGRPQDAGCFALIMNLANLIMLPRLAVNTYLTPMIATYYARRDYAGLAQIVGKTSLWSFAGALAVGAGIWIMSPLLLGWYGPSFLAGRTSLAVLILGQFVASSAGAQLQLLKMSGREIAAAKVLSISLTVQVALGAVLVPQLGMLGAALASLGCLLTWNLSMMPLVWRHLGIRPGSVHWTGPSNPINRHTR
jgi:O-antigen/teichoic acid export membrane protein